MFDFLKGKLADAQATFSKYADTETAEAVVAIMTGVAWADGDLEASEKTKMLKGFGVHPLLKQFPQTQLVAKFTELSAIFEMDVPSGQDACLKELDDVVKKRSSMEKLAVIMRMGVMIANADGEIEPEERVFLNRCADRLGVQITDFLAPVAA